MLTPEFHSSSILTLILSNNSNLENNINYNKRKKLYRISIRINAYEKWVNQYYKGKQITDRSLLVCNMIDELNSYFNYLNEERCLPIYLPLCLLD